MIITPPSVIAVTGINYQSFLPGDRCRVGKASHIRNVKRPGRENMLEGGKIYKRKLSVFD